MVTSKALLLNGLLALSLSYPQLSAANGFTSANVLKWSEESQNSFFQTSVNMIGIVATRTGEHDHIAECIDGWFSGPVEGAEQRAARIREVMRELPDFHPQVVIQVVIEKECGKF